MQVSKDNDAYITANPDFPSQNREGDRLQLQRHARHPEHPMRTVDRKQMQPRLNTLARVSTHRYLLAERFEE